MTKRKVFKKDELKKPVLFSCRDCGSKELTVVYVAKGNINVEDDDGTIRKEQVKKRYRDCQGCGARYATFESIIYKVNRRNAKTKAIKNKKGT